MISQFPLLICWCRRALTAGMSFFRICASILCASTSRFIREFLASLFLSFRRIDAGQYRTQRPGCRSWMCNDKRTSFLGGHWSLLPNYDFLNQRAQKSSIDSHETAKPLASIVCHSIMTAPPGVVSKNSSSEPMSAAFRSRTAEARLLTRCEVFQIATLDFWAARRSPPTRQVLPLRIHLPGSQATPNVL